MTGVGAPLTVPFAGTYSIEMPNVDLTGWVGKTYDLSGNRTGSGQRASILHIVPADENATPQSSAIQVFDYKARFSTPVHVALDTPTPFQSLQFRLRNIETGELLQDLKHPTQIVLRILERANFSTASSSPAPCSSAGKRLQGCN